MKFVFALFTLVLGLMGGAKTARDDRLPGRKVGRIIGGMQATSGQFPWQASVKIRYADDSLGECGGALIDPSWVLTAAHCTQQGVAFEVRLGSLFKKQGGMVFFSDVCYSHLGYNSSTNVNNWNHDIALIKLPRPVIESGTIKVIKLLPNDVTVLNKLQISGWGDMSGTGTSFPLTLMFANVVQLGYDQCLVSYSSLTPQTMCTVGSVEDPAQTPCIGDGGGPVVLPGTTPYLVAVIAFGPSECKSQPSGHTRVVPYKTWIKNRTGLEL